MTEFYLVRHGKTVFNLEGRFQGGAVDSELLSSSLDESKNLGEELKEISFDLLITSEQSRAIKTGSVIACQNLNYSLMMTRKSKSLNEINFGVWDGVLENEIAYTEQLNLFRYSPEKFDARVIGGEQLYEVFARMNKTFDDLAQEFPNGKILVVSHGMALLAFVNSILKRPYNQFRELPVLENNSVSIISKTKNEWKVSKWNNKYFTH